MLLNIGNLKEIKNALILFFFLILISFSNNKIQQADTVWVEPEFERRQKLDPRLFKSLSFGHLPVALDWFLMTILSDPLTTHVEPGTHPQIYYDLDLLTDLDPAFQDVYVAGADLLSVIRNDGPGARDLLLKGEQFLKHQLPDYPEQFKKKFWNNSWMIPVVLAYVQLFELNDMKNASEAFVQASEIPGAPSYLARLKQKFSRPGGVYEVGLRLLNFMLIGANDDRMRTELLKKRLNLYIGQFLFELNQSFLNYLNLQPGYNSRASVASKQMGLYWADFLKSTQTPVRDPWGGTVFIDHSGKVATTTPHEPVFGLE